MLLPVVSTKSTTKESIRNKKNVYSFLDYIISDIRNKHKSIFFF